MNIKHKNELVLKIFVNTTKDFLQKLVASFDFEDLLPEKGSYNGSNLKW